MSGLGTPAWGNLVNLGLDVDEIVEILTLAAEHQELARITATEPDRIGQALAAGLTFTQLADPRTWALPAERLRVMADLNTLARHSTDPPRGDRP